MFILGSRSQEKRNLGGGKGIDYSFAQAALIPKQVGLGPRTCLLKWDRSKWKFR